jgi:catechol 2,3-dioxygenase-like lactoylglutathione lyase family enzyme
MVTIDAPDPGKLADFYSALLGWEIAHRGEDYAMLSAEGSAPIGFGRVENYQAPAWPDPASPKQFHLDFYVDDLDVAEKEALALGATKPEFQPGERWRVMLDPAGHPLCLCLRPPA